jgi:copper transport protein
MQLAEPLIAWPRPLVALLEFLGVFLAAGAVGFRFTALRGRLASVGEAPTGPDGDLAFYARAARRAASIGLVGALIGLAHMAYSLVGLAARRKVSVGTLVFGTPVMTLWVLLAVAAAVGFALARARMGPGWWIAAVGVVAGTLRNALVGQWGRLVNPVHLLAGGLWIGTLFVLAVAGFALLFAAPLPSDRRGPLTAAMVGAFSPLALTSGGVLVVFGVVTAWRHLGELSALWTTPYGIALLAKLAVVFVVFALGAWNWRRIRPTLGGEAAALQIGRTARAERAAAGLVLLITTILVSLPAPAEARRQAATPRPAVTAPR